MKKKIKLKKKKENYFIKKYFQPDIQINLSKKLFKFANTSIDLSDGLISDLEKMINKQNLSYELNGNTIPISKHLARLIKMKKLNKYNFISKGDDYQILFTANSNKARIILDTSKNLGIKITKIGKIISGFKKSNIIGQKSEQIKVKSQGYTHQF